MKREEGSLDYALAKLAEFFDDVTNMPSNATFSFIATISTTEQAKVYAVFGTNELDMLDAIMDCLKSQQLARIDRITQHKNN